MKVALISMPFASFTYPSIGISLLQAELHREGIPCDIYYLNLKFAARIGCLSYLALGVLSPMTSLTGEWLFTADLFGSDPRRDEAYVQDVLKQDFANHFRPRVVRRLLEVRECVPKFLDECLENVPWARYDVVGFTSSFQQHVPSLALAKRVRKAFPGKTIIFGGANCEGEMGIESHRRFNFVDFVCSGEGDRAFPELIRRLASGDKAPEVAGIISRKGRETVVPREIVSPVFDLDGLPFPSYDDYFDQRQKLRLNRGFTTLIPYETSRGCWWGAKMHCTFCGLNGATMTYRSKTPARALDELAYLGKKYGKRFVGVDNILDLKYLDSFFPQLAARNLRLSLYFDTKVNLTKNQIKVLRDAGVRYLQPGIESLSTPILKLMKKGCNLLQNVQFMKWCKQLGVEVDWNFLYGFPGEPPSEYVEMAKFIPFLSHLDPPGGCGRIRTDRFSPYFMRPAEYGLTKIRPVDAYHYVYPFESETLARLAYYFDFRSPQEKQADNYAQPAVKEVNAWRSAKARGQLKGIILPDTLMLVDTRNRRKPSTTVLEEPLRTAYIYCDQSRGFSAIQAHLSMCLPSLSCTSGWLEEALKDLVSRGLMLKDGKSYLGLAILPDSNPAIDSQVPIALDHQNIPAEDLIQLGGSPQPSGNPL